MFMASASALRSADLSRQVGAIIANNRGEQISSGCNEVPQAKGGAFWEGTDQTTKDYRDFQEGFDAN
ncbi:cytidine deaminase, partial [Klebsiella pneumoniae]